MFIIVTLTFVMLQKASILLYSVGTKLSHFSRLKISVL